VKGQNILYTAQMRYYGHEWQSPTPLTRDAAEATIGVILPDSDTVGTCYERDMGGIEVRVERVATA
jgi:hypothetical protein